MSTNVLTIVRHLLNLAEGKKTAIPAALTPEKLLFFCQKSYFALTGEVLLLEDFKLRSHSRIHTQPKLTQEYFKPIVEQLIMETCLLNTRIVLDDVKKGNISEYKFGIQKEKAF